MSVRPLIPELAKKARENCKEDDSDKLQDALQQIKDWLALQPHIHARTDDQWLAAHIRGYKFDLEKVKKRLDLCYTFRQTASEFFQLHHKDAKFKELVETGFYLPLPKLSDPAGPRVTLIRPGVFDLAEVNMINVFAAAHIINKIMMVDDDNAIIVENVVIIDLKNTNLLPFMLLSPTESRKLFVIQETIPFTTVDLIHINVPQEFNLLFNAIKLTDNTIKPYIYSYTENYEEIYTELGVSKEIMPVEYGGNGGTLMEITDHWMKKVEEYSEWLEEDLQFGTDESKRPGKPRTAETMFGESTVKNPYHIVKSECIHQ